MFHPLHSLTINYQSLAIHDHRHKDILLTLAYDFQFSSLQLLWMMESCRKPLRQRILRRGCRFQKDSNRNCDEL